MGIGPPVLRIATWIVLASKEIKIALVSLMITELLKTRLNYSVIWKFTGLKFLRKQQMGSISMNGINMEHAT